MCTFTTEKDLETIAGGSTALVKLRGDNTHVEKAPYPGSRDFHLSIRDLRREYAIYQRLPQHPRLLRLHPDSTPERLVLPYLRKGCLRDYLRASTVSPIQRLQFASDAAEGLHVLHSASIVHGDLSSWNFLLDNANRLCIIDFAGSTMDGKAGSAFEGVQYCLPRSMDDPSTIRTDIFALGSLIYEISTSRIPYQDYDDEEVEDRFRRNLFPSTESLPLGRIVLGCWQGAYESAQCVYKDIREISDEL